MENCELGSLWEYMDNNMGLSEDEIRESASGCLLGLEVLHSQHIMHGVMDD